jgi:hypothetical protein
VSTSSTTAPVRSSAGSPPPTPEEQAPSSAPIALPPPSLIERVIQGFASLKLAVACLAFATVLVFLGTIAQVDEGLYNAQARYFRSLFIYWAPKGADWKLPIFPGGYLVGGLLLINLITTLADRLRSPRGRVGLIIAHVGLILLLLGQFATDVLSVETHMRLREGEAKNYSESSSDTELAIIDATNPDSDEVFPVPARTLARENDIQLEGLPFSLRVKKFYENARVERRAGENATLPPAAPSGVGQELTVQPVPPVVKMDERNLPAAAFEVVTPEGSLGTWFTALVLDEPQRITVKGKTYSFQLRPTRFYKPFSLTLLKFSHDQYRGTDIPKNFSSRLRVQRAATGEDREVLIYMNNPLRYGGETFYQSGYDERDPKITILQVVHNPSWLTPYLACLLVGVGLAVQFLSHLLRFVRQRTTA